MLQTCIRPSWFHCHSLSLASVKSWYRLTRVVPEKGPLNGCVCVCVQTIIMLTVTRIPCYSYQYKLHCAIVTNYMFLYETNSFCVICADTGRGLMALKYLKPGDVIISLPESLLVTSCSVLTSSAIGPALRRFVTRTAVSYRIVYSLNNNDLFNGLVSWYQKNIHCAFLKKYCYMILVA